MSEFDVSQSIGEIVTLLPKASEVFREFSIDFCCGGHRPLADAIKEQKLDAEAVLAKLERAYEEAMKSADRTDFGRMTSSELIDYIVNTHHAYLKRNLPEISELATMILKVHGPNHSDLFKVHKLFHQLKTDLDQHLIKEEEMLFPMIKEYDEKPSPELRRKIEAVMKETEQEHETAGGVLKELRKITKEYEVPQDGCGTYRMTFDKLRELEADLFQHIHLENNILFRRLDIEAGTHSLS